jgi:hypothetical protein
VYTLIIGGGRIKYKTAGGLKRRLELQAETERNGSTSFARVEVSMLGGVESIDVKFSKSANGSSWEWEATPGIPH